MLQDKKQQVLDNLAEQWMGMPFGDKRDFVEEGLCVATFAGTLLNSARLAGKGNWPAAFYNLAIAGGMFALLVNS